MDIKKITYKNILHHNPYTTKERYDTLFKEDHKALINKLKNIIDIRKEYSLADICCGNGELLYHLKKEFPRWALHGFDIEKAFIDTARSFNGLSGVTFAVKDMFDVKGEFDIVTCTGSLQIFHEIEKPLEKLLELCKKGGIVICDGLFNKYDVEVMLYYCDNSKPELEGKWVTDFNKHSRKRIASYLAGKVEAFEFEDIVMNAEIPFDPDKPASFAFTFKDSDGNVIITNGMGCIVNKTLLTILK